MVHLSDGPDDPGVRFASNGVKRDAQASGVNQSSVDWRRGAVPPATTRSHHGPHPTARSRRIWRMPDRWFPPRLVPSFRGPGGVGSQVLPSVHKARTTLAIVLQVLTSGEATSCSSTATAFVTPTQNCRTSCTKTMCKSPVCKRLNWSLAPPSRSLRDIQQSEETEPPEGVVSCVSCPTHACFRSGTHLT